MAADRLSFGELFVPVSGAPADTAALVKHYSSGQRPQKAALSMSPEKEQQLIALSTYVQLTAEDRTAALVLSAQELEFCRWFKTSPASLLETKRLMAHGA